MIKVKIYIDNHILETEVKDISREQFFEIVRLQLTTREYIHLGGIIVDKRHLRALEFSEVL